MTSTTGWRGLRGSVAAVGLVAALAVSGQAAAGQGAGDFDGDKRDDLAIGVPFESVDGAAFAGAVNVIYGTKKGLRAKGNQFWHQGNSGVSENLEVDDNFGSALAVGDFDKDGFDDLAVGVPGENAGSVFDTGVVHVLYGSDSGLDTLGAQLWSQAGGVIDSPESNDDFGEALTTGDFNGDGYDDLAIGAPGETNGTGVVHILFGSTDGLTESHPDILPSGNQIFSQAVAGMAGAHASGERFGSALAAGDFDKDGFDDLAVGVPFDTVGAFDDAGGVNVIYGSADGLLVDGPTTIGNQLWHQDSPEILGEAEDDEFFGIALTVGDFDGDRFDDLAVGVSGEGLPDGAGGEVFRAGAVNLLHGSADGLSAERNQFWHQDSEGVKGIPESPDRFGSALAAGDFGKGRFDDLAIGVPVENVPDGAGGTISGAGAVSVLYGTKKGLRAKGNQLWHQNKKGIAGQAVQDEEFGASLAVGRFNKGGHRDLAIGVPSEEVPDGAGDTISGAGAVNVIYGSKKGLSKKRDQIWHQDKEGVLDSAEPSDGFGGALPGSSR